MAESAGEQDKVVLDKAELEQDQAVDKVEQRRFNWKYDRLR